MRSAPLAAAFLLAFSAAYHTALAQPHEIVVCRSAIQSPERHARWAQEADSAYAHFAAGLAALGHPAGRRTLPIAQCPSQVKDGCYSKGGNIYCSDIAIERALFALALLLDKARQWADSGTALDRLGVEPYTGHPPFIVVDSLLFPKWWESYQFRFSSFAMKVGATTWIAGAKDLHKKQSDPVYRRARDLLAGFVLGHESLHAYGSCPIAEPSYAEKSGYFERAVALQQNEYWCPSPPDNVEVNADACGLRWLERVERAGGGDAPDPVGAKLSRAAVAIALQQIFDIGLRVPRVDQLDWRATGYLYPHLRTVLVHRTLFHLGDGEPRVGICGDALGLLWEDAYNSRVCVTHESGNDYNVLLAPTPHDSDAWKLFPSARLNPADTHSKICLSGTSQLPTTGALARGSPNVSIRVTALKPEVRQQSVMMALESAQRELDRPQVHAGLSACMPKNALERRFDIRYTAKGVLDQVRGNDPAECGCVRDALKGLKFAESLHHGPVDPDKPYIEPGYVMTLEFRRKPNLP